MPPEDFGYAPTIHMNGYDIPWSPTFNMGERIIFYCRQGHMLASDHLVREVAMSCVYDAASDEMVIQGDNGGEWEKCVTGAGESRYCQLSIELCD